MATKGRRRTDENRTEMSHEQQQHDGRRRGGPQHLHLARSPPATRGGQGRRHRPRRHSLMPPPPQTPTEPLLVNETAHVDYSRMGTPAPSLMTVTPDHSNRTSWEEEEAYARLGAQDRFREHQVHRGEMATPGHHDERSLSEQLTPGISNRKGVRCDIAARMQLQAGMLFHEPKEPQPEDQGNVVSDEEDDLSTSAVASQETERQASDEWTLQSFANHQKREKRRKRSKVKRQLSLTSGYSRSDSLTNSLVTNSPDGMQDEANGSDKAALSSSLVLTGEQDDGFSDPRKRRMLKFAVACTSLLTLFVMFLASTDVPSLLGMVNLKALQEQHHEQAREEWHPLFQHSSRTADVEVEVPSSPGPAKPVMQDKARQPKNQRNKQRRREQELDSLTVGIEEDNGQTPADNNEPAFIQGELVQDLCPATHTLFSQSLILRSSYGNIFSITTPSSPARQRNVFQSEADEEKGNLFNRNLQLGGTGGSFEDTGNFFDIDTETESVYDGTGIETITIRTLSLRMADFRPNENTHFEVWVYTGSGDDIELNENDLDDDPTNNNRIPPSKGEYQGARAKFTDWQLISEGMERELIPDTDFYDHNGHVFNIGAGTTIGPLGRLDRFENMEDVSLAAAEWNEGQIGTDGGMQATTAEGEVTATYFYKIPEEKFMPLKLPKNNGKATLFVTLDRVGLQYGYAAKQEFDLVDVTKHDYIDQTPSLDVLNGNVDLRMHVGEGVIFYPWMEEEFFYQTRRFLGKIWYDALIPCEYVPVVVPLEVPSPTAVPTTATPTTMPSEPPTGNGTAVAADLLISVLIKDGPLPPMPDDVKEIFEDTLLDFVNDEFGDFCPLTWGEEATVTDQDLSAIGGAPTGASSVARKRNGGSSGENTHQTADRIKTSDGNEDDPHYSSYHKSANENVRYLRQMLEPIFNYHRPSRDRLLNAITLLDASTTVDALYNSNECPNKTPDELAAILEKFINDNSEELLEKLKAAHDYFKDAFGVSADIIGGPPVDIRSSELVTEEDDKNMAAIIGGIIAALLLCCFCCCLPLLVIRRRRRKESKENEIIGEDIEWARPVDEDLFPPLGGFRDDTDFAGGEGFGGEEDMAKRRKRPDGELPEELETPPEIGLMPIPPGIRPVPDDTEMVHSHRWLDKEPTDDTGKQRPFGLPGRMPGEDNGPDPYAINIYPGGDYEEGQGSDDDLNLRHIEGTPGEDWDTDWKPDHYEPDGGVHGYDRESKSVEVNAGWNRLPKKDGKDLSPKKGLNIKQMLLQRKKDLEAKKNKMRQVEMVEKGIADDDDDQMFPKAEPDSRIEDLMSRIKTLEKDRTKKYNRQDKMIEESDYERWKRLNIENAELSDSDDSSDDDMADLAATRKKKKKKKKRGDDYMLHFDDLDAYNRALAVHQDAYIHKWVKVKVEKEDAEDDGALIDDVEMESNVAPSSLTGPSSNAGDDIGEEFIGDMGGEEADGGGKARPSFPRQQTEYLGDIPDDDVEEGDEVGAGGRGGARPSLPRQQTEYIGDIPEDESEEEEPAAMGTAGIKAEITELVKQVLPEQVEFLDELLAQFEGREEALKATLLKKAEAEGKTPPAATAAPAGAAAGAAAAAAAPSAMKRKPRFGKEPTVRFGGGDQDDGPTKSDERGGDRRAMLSREKTEYIGSVRGMEEEEDDTPSDRRALLSREKTEYIGSIRGGMEEEEDDVPSRRSLLSKQKTEYIGDLEEEE